MKRTEVAAVSADPQRTFADSLEWFHRLDDVPDRQILRTLGQHKAAMEAAPRLDQARPHKALHQFCQVGPGNLRDFRDSFDGAWLSGLLGQYDNGPQRILDGLRDHGSFRKIKNRTLTSFISTAILYNNRIFRSVYLLCS